MKELSKEVRMAQRVEICKDVIAQLRAGHYQARANHSYLDAGEKLIFDVCRRESRDLSTVDAQVVVDKILGPDCTLCQRGGLLLSAIRKFDDLQLTHADQLHNEAMGVGDRDYLRRWFTEAELFQLECVFETFRDGNDHVRFPGWDSTYPNDTDRMDAIMRNVIAHDGEFVPTDIPRPRRKPLSQLLAATGAR